VILATEEDEEDDGETVKQYAQVAENWLPRMELKDAMKQMQSVHTYWIFDDNSFPKEADTLRAEGQKVFGTTALAERMEHDRHYAMQIAKDEAHLDTMSTHEFKTIEEGLMLLDKNPDKAYVFKPDDGKFNWMTFVPVRQEDADANREVYHYMAHMKDEPGDYILQERIKLEDGLEVNCELWLYEGEPFLATVGLELKRKDTYDVGEMSGCAGDFVQVVPLDTPLLEKTIYRFLPFYQEKKYTGLVDVNVIFTPDNKPHFLEVCNRFGYNCHATVFMGLAKDGFGNIIADICDGKVENFASRFSKDIGCSLTLFLDHPRPGLPVHIDPRWAHHYFPYDGYKEDGLEEHDLLLTGYSDEVGIFVDAGRTVEDAWKHLSEKIAFEESVSFPDMKYRWDLADTNYYNAPVLRYRELQKRGLL